MPLERASFNLEKWLQGSSVENLSNTPLVSRSEKLSERQASIDFWKLLAYQIEPINSHVGLWLFAKPIKLLFTRTYVAVVFAQSSQGQRKLALTLENAPPPTHDKKWCVVRKTAT